MSPRLHVTLLNGWLALQDTLGHPDTMFMGLDHDAAPRMNVSIDTIRSECDHWRTAPSPAAGPVLHAPCMTSLTGRSCVRRATLEMVIRDACADKASNVGGGRTL